MREVQLREAKATFSAVVDDARAFLTSVSHRHQRHVRCAAAGNAGASRVGTMDGAK